MNEQTTNGAASDNVPLETEKTESRITISYEWFRAWRRAAGQSIDPATAEVTWWYALTLDPYGVCPDLPEEYQQVGREYFARAPGSDLCISFDDLPDETREALWKRHRSTLAFPAGVPTASEGRSISKSHAESCPAEPENYFSIAEACAIAGIRRTSLYKAIRAGALRATKIGRRTLITAEDLCRWLDRMPAILPKAPTKSDGAS